MVPDTSRFLPNWILHCKKGIIRRMKKESYYCLIGQGDKYEKSANNI